MSDDIPALKTLMEYQKLAVEVACVRFSISFSVALQIKKRKIVSVSPTV